MWSLKNYFRNKAFLVPVSKAEKEMLEYFMQNKAEFESWLSSRSGNKIRFQFYYPAAIDFYFDDFKLFTAYYKKSILHKLEFSELKMSETNYTSIRSGNWRPFEEVMINFLTTLEESKKIALFEKRKSLLEYEAICKGKVSGEDDRKVYFNAIPAPKLEAMTAVR